MKGWWFILVLILSSLSFAQTPETKQRKVLIVVSSYGKDGGKTWPGYEFDEFSQAYIVYKTNGFEIDVSSPRGGKVEPDEFNNKKPYNKQVAEDSAAMSKLANTIATASVDPAKYDIVFVVGGKGAMFDLPYDSALQDLIAAFYARKETVLAAVCHGPAAFVNVRLPGGKFMIEGKNLTGYTNAEESMFGKKWKPEFPFLLEDRIKARGAAFLNGDMMLPFITRSGKLVTGQNPYSTLETAETSISMLGLTPVARASYADEKSMALIKRAIAGSFETAKSELAANNESFDIELIAVYGYYRLLGANNEQKAIVSALNIIELVAPYYYNPTLQLEKAKGYRSLGQFDVAKKLLEELLAKTPDDKEAKEVLAQLSQ